MSEFFRHMGLSAATVNRGLTETACLTIIVDSLLARVSELEARLAEYESRQSELTNTTPDRKRKWKKTNSNEPWQFACRT